MRGSFNQWRFLWPWTLIRIISGITVKCSWPLAALLWNIQFSSAISISTIQFHFIFLKTNLISLSWHVHMHMLLLLFSYHTHNTVFFNSNGRLFESINFFSINYAIRSLSKFLKSFIHFYWIIIIVVDSWKK